jgi:hypothetical protein
MAGKRFKLIACEIYKGEIEALVPKSSNFIEVTILPIGLHAAGKELMPLELQKAIDAVEAERFDAILLLYGLCNHGISGLHAPIPLVAPRAHDCITLFMGSKEQYKCYFDLHPGTYYATAGIFGTNLSLENLTAEYDSKKAEYLEKYDEDTAEYLMETLGNPLKNYHNITFINNGIGNIEMARNCAHKTAADLNWTCDEFSGNTGLIERLFAGDWNGEEFLVLNPGSKIEPSYGADIIRAAGICS